MTRILYISLFVCLLLSFNTKVKSQIQNQLVHINQNLTAINPANTTINNLVKFQTLYSKQWVGFEGSPQTIILSGEYPLVFKNIGLGATLTNEKYGNVLTNNISGDFSYKLRLARSRTLAFGFKASMQTYNVDISQLKAFDNNDLCLQKNISMQLAPNFGFGVMFTTNTFYVGFSAPKLLDNTFDNDKVRNTFSNLLRGNLNLMGGFRYKATSEIELKPEIIIAQSPAQQLFIYFSAGIVYSDLIQFSAIYRTNSIAAAILYNVTEQLAFSYSYNYNTSKIRSYQQGSHEVMLIYAFSLKIRSTSLLL